MDIHPNAAVNIEKSHRLISWLLILVLFILRIPFEGIIRIFSEPNWVFTVYQIGTYFFTAVFLWWECKNLKDFHIDHLALWIIVLAKPIMTIIFKDTRPYDQLAFPHIPSLLLWAIAIGLAITLWLRRNDLPRFQWKSLGWFGVGTLVGVGLAAVLAVPGAYLWDTSYPPYQFWLMLKQHAFTGFIGQIGWAGVAEEPLFRGFLWGALRKAGWKEVWIWLLQAGLFTLAHMYYFGKYPISLFVIVPACALVFGLIVWKSRTISASLPAHGAVNALAPYFELLAAYFIK